MAIHDINHGNWQYVGFGSAMKPSLAYTLVVILNIGLGAFLPPVARADDFFKSDSLPPLDGKYLSPAGFHAHYQTSGVLIKDVSHSGFSTTFSPPTAGNNQLHNFGSSVQFRVSMDGGITFSNVVAPASVSVRVTHASAAGTTRVFDTEMLQLDITGGELPLGVALRESPALVSPGLSTIRSVSGGYRIEKAQ